MVDQDMINAIENIVLKAIGPIYKKMSETASDVKVLETKNIQSRRDIDSNLDLITMQNGRITEFQKKTNLLWNDRKWVKWLVGIFLSLAGLVAGYFMK